MADKHDGARGTAVYLLQRYLRLAAQEPKGGAGAPFKWDRDNDSEVAEIVDAILHAARQAAREEASGVLRDELTPAQTATQEEDASEGLQTMRDALSAIVTSGSYTGVTCPLCGVNNYQIHSQKRREYIECESCNMLWQFSIGGNAACPECEGVSVLVYTDNVGPDAATCTQCGHVGFWHDFHERWHEFTHIERADCHVCRFTLEK